MILLTPANFSLEVFTNRAALVSAPVPAGSQPHPCWHIPYRNNKTGHKAGIAKGPLRLQAQQATSRGYENVSAAITVPPEIKKFVHQGIILEEKNGEQGAKAESTALVVLQGGVWQCFRKRPVKAGMTRCPQH